MLHKKEVDQWIALANNDLALAEHTVRTMTPIPYEIVCFHCQQYVEKYLKAFLVSKGQEPPYIHDLVKLNALCEAENQIFGEIKQKCIVITEFGVQPRYPGNMQIIEEDMHRALQFAVDIKAFIMENMAELFQKDDNHQ